MNVPQPAVHLKAGDEDDNANYSHLQAAAIPCRGIYDHVANHPGVLARDGRMAWKATVLVCFTVFAAAGCASKALLRRDEVACKSAGFRHGTPDFSACLQREAMNRRCSSNPTLSLHIKPQAALRPGCSDPM
jgi:hypothetical protein